MSDVRRTRRLLAVVAGVLLLAVSALFFELAVFSARLDAAYPQIFPPGARVDVDLWDRGAADLQRVEVGVAVAGADTQVDISLELLADSSFTDAVAEGEFTKDSGTLAWNLAGNPEIVVADQLVPLAWSTPVVTRGTSETALVQLSGTPHATEAGYFWGGPVEVAMQRWEWSCDADCVVQLEVDADPGHTVSEAVVEGTVVAQEPQHVTALLSPGSTTVTLASTDQALGAVPGAVPQPTGALVSSFAAYLWPLVPWVVLYAVLRRWRPADADVDADAAPERARAGARLGDRCYLLLALGMVPLAFAGVNAVTAVVQWIGSGISDQPVAAVPFVFGAGVLEAAYAMWAVSALSWGGRPRPWVVVVTAVMAAAALAAVVLVLVSRPSEPGIVFDDPGWVRGQLFAGIGVGLLAVVVFCWGIGRQWRQAMLPMTTGMGVLVVVSVLGVTWAPAANVAGAVVSALATAAVLLVLARLALGDLLRISDRSRGSRRVGQGLALAALLLIVLPSVLQQGGADTYLAAGATYALRSLVPLALILTAVIVLRARAVSAAAAQPLPRAVVLLLSASLMLRPEVLYAGIPWSFGVGLLLIVLVLFPRSDSWGSDWTPSPQQNAPAVIRDTLRASSKAATFHHLQDALRKKFATAEVDAKDADATRQVVVQAFGEVPPRPGLTSMRDAFIWAGERNAWRRAVTGGAAATLVGLVLQLGTLADTVSQISGFFGSRPWGTVAATALAFRFPLYGFVFGYFFPLIPGATGLVKSLRLLAVLAGSESALLLVPFGDTATVEAVTIRILQMAVVCLVLGVGADYLTLRQCDSGAGGLGDIYNTSHLVLWSSGVAVAAATALATALAGSAMTLLVERIVPAPPAQVSTSQSGAPDPATQPGGPEP